MKENKIKELQEKLETLHVTQDARLACNADDLDIREEIAEVEEEIKELQDDTNADRENNIKNERSSIEEDIKILENMNDGYTFKDCDICNNYNEKTKHCDKHKCMELQALEHILSDYKRVLKENEELKSDIKNMYDEEVVISIIEDNFNLCRNEVLEMLGSDE